ncbi:MAG: 4-hydroxythreonine-4-phosphate dehydrogenase PdxA [Elusimicrobia bacterium HGW-Elusimicrobia-1]|nr:MAG: 4-hydroxythreonine-4-phosphate dehydrogenase PdxA [Elusimicrobia bacterium HGW-Elusimicrobia-1]
MTKPRLAVTLGDPSGIGPEVVAAALARRDVSTSARVVLVGDPAFVRNRAPSLLRSVEFLKVPAPSGIVAGRPSRAAGIAAIESLAAAVTLAMSGAVDGIVTAPASKVSLALAGSKHTGHTELLREAAGGRHVEMMMTAGNIRAILLTRHIPLSAVSREISAKKIIAAARLYADIFGKSSRLCVCALNPHSGDDGLIGSEETRIITPAVRRLAASGFRVRGPLSSDTAFSNAAAGEFDAVLAMYHDQAMIPLKVLYPRSVVNVTLGLPFVRTSPGHGTACDIAGSGVADESPTAEAIKFAARNWRLFRR